MNDFFDSEISILPDVCMGTWEATGFFITYLVINRKEMLQLVHRHKSVNLWDDKLEKN